MKRILQEDLERIHRLNYKNGAVNEQFWDKLKEKIGFKKVDDSKKADLVTNDVEDFFKTLEDLSKTDGLTQQEGNLITYQKDVETMQMALQLLGYELPKFGVDGRFGPETARAVEVFKKDSNVLNESSAQLRSDIKSLGYKEKSGQLDSGGDISDDISGTVGEILKDFKTTNPNVGVTITSGNDKFHKGLSYNSQHKYGNAVDLTLQPANRETKSAFENILNLYKTKDAKFKYINEYDHPSSASTGGHFHLQYGGNSSGGGSGDSTSIVKAFASPSMLRALFTKIKERGVTSDELKKLIDSVKLNASNINVDVKDWQGMVNLVIDKLEGGYYHPDMLNDGRVKDSRYGASGETMFGLDRRAGKNESTAEGREFWAYVDSLNARSNWKWNYMAKDNRELGSKLRVLAGNYIKPLYAQFMKSYMSSEAAAIVNNYAPLTFNFIYATWNGPGWFERFSKPLNKSVASGNTDPKSLNDLINQVRAGSGNSLISQGAPKVASVTNALAQKDTSSMA
jgi:peptidoglycan hydrolase-like protein with peptidoglycan-binding domain